MDLLSPEQKTAVSEFRGVTGATELIAIDLLTKGKWNLVATINGYYDGSLVPGALKTTTPSTTSSPPPIAQTAARNTPAVPSPAATSTTSSSPSPSAPAPVSPSPAPKAAEVKSPAAKPAETLAAKPAPATGSTASPVKPAAVVASPTAPSSTTNASTSSSSVPPVASKPAVAIAKIDIEKLIKLFSLTEEIAKDVLTNEGNIDAAIKYMEQLTGTKVTATTGTGGRKKLVASLVMSSESNASSNGDDLGLNDSGFWEEEGLGDAEKLVVRPTDPNMDPNHDPNQIDWNVAFLPPPEEQLALTILNKMQTDAVRHVVDISKKASLEAHSKLLARVQAKKWTEAELNECYRYIRDRAPILIHVNLDKVLSFLLKDTHYRNQFETGTSGGTLSTTTRTGWERRMFNGIYDQSNAFDRVKYGVLNIVNDHCGVKSCYHYGDSYFVLRKVRLRATFGSKDTGYEDARLASCEYYAHILMEYNDLELQNVMEVANKRVASRDSSSIALYKEIQIHGPVILKEHISMLVVNARHKGQQMQKEVEKFCAQNEITWMWMEPRVSEILASEGEQKAKQPPKKQPYMGIRPNAPKNANIPNSNTSNSNINNNAKTPAPANNSNGNVAKQKNEYPCSSCTFHRGAPIKCPMCETPHHD